MKMKRIACVACGIVIFSSALFAQTTPRPQPTADRSVPSSAYFSIFNLYFDGEFKEACDRFQSESRGSIKSAQSRWIDSICYEAMTGECFYQVGELDKALARYENAIKLFIAYSGWMTQVQFPTTLREAPANAYKAAPWGATKRPIKMVNLPDSMLIFLGKLDNTTTVKQGGVVQMPISYSIHPQEIVRCTALAIRRRAEILGPVAARDQLTSDLLVASSGQLCAPNHWSETWANLEKGLAFVAAGKDQQGADYLKRSLTLPGGVDHPLTAVAFLELGKLVLKGGDARAALALFEEAAFSAVNFPDQSVLEESFRYAAVTHVMLNAKGPYRPLFDAVQGIRPRDMRFFRTTAATYAAEQLAIAGQTKEATAMIEEARTMLGRKTIAAGVAGARVNFVAAMILAQQRRGQESQMAFDAAMGYMRHGSLKVFRLGAAELAYASGMTQMRSAHPLYNETLADSTPNDWVFDPMETLAFEMASKSDAYDHWFDVAIARKETEAALDVADRARRHRFTGTLPLAGRVQSFRRLIDAPLDVLDREAQLQRQDLLTRYPELEKLVEEARAIRKRIATFSIVPEQTSSQKDLGKALEELAAVGKKMDPVIWEIALRREPSGPLFPPVRSAAEMRKALPQGHAVLVFYVSGKKIHGFLVGRDNYCYWDLGDAQNSARKVMTLLKSLGQHQQNGELTAKDLSDDKWKQSASQFLDQLLKTSRADFSKPFDELAIVPDGPLWYLPFEALQVKADGKMKPLIAQFRIRYAPTLSLAVWPYEQPVKGQVNTLVYLGKLFPQDAESAAEEAYRAFADAVPNTFSVKKDPLSPSSLYWTIADRVVVFDDVSTGDEPTNWLLAPADKGKGGGTLRDWFALPWGAPRQVILPGFHTAAEDGLKKMNRQAPGGELFLASCAMMSEGSRTILLSRWRCGGQSSFEIIREFVQQLADEPPADAWQRAVMLTMESRVNVESEPRLKKSGFDEPPQANHPFFWSGYMLIDCGVKPSEDAVKVEDASKAKKNRRDAAAEELKKEKAAAKKKDAEDSEEPEKLAPVEDKAQSTVKKPVPQNNKKKAIPANKTPSPEDLPLEPSSTGKDKMPVEKKTDGEVKEESPKETTESEKKSGGKELEDEPKASESEKKGN